MSSNNNSIIFHFMQKYFILFVLFLFGLNTGISQKRSFNTTLLSSVGFGSENSNDTWGYVDDNGTQYAIIGNARNTRVFSLEDPTNPILRHTAPGAQSVWRDIKSFNKHLYVTTDQGTDGLVIIDMTKAPDTISHIYFQPLLTVGTTTKNLERCHNLYIDEKGYCYLSGCNISRGGVLIFDLNQDPKSPVYVGAADLNYSHDNFARGDTLYSSEINAGQLGIYDIRDRSNPVLLATRTTSRNFTHNAWPSDDSRYIFTTDERPNAYVDAYDLTDLNNIRLLDKFRPLEREGEGVIPHNTHYFNGYMAVSWYTDGLRIVDVHKPDNMIEVAYYDTWEDPATCHSGFSGCWGAFPFTDNNLIYASDINNGLYIVEVDYKRAAYLEGKITDINGKALEGVKVTIHSDQVNREFSDASGIYKTGHAFYGDFVVEASHPDFETYTDTVDFRAGEVTEWNVVMKKPENFDLTFQIVNEENNPIPATIEIRYGNLFTPVQVDESGTSTFNVQGKNYDIIVTSWGYIPKVLEGVSIKEATTLPVTLERGYVETFETDLGWEIVSTSANMRGVWQIAVPRATYDATGKEANPGSDAAQDYGLKAFVTENGIPGAPCADVDNGTTTLISPTIDLTEYENPMLSFSYWFYTSGGNTAFNDTLKVYLTNGETEVLLLKRGSTTDDWQRAENIKLKDLLVLTDDMRVIVEVGDEAPNGHIVEAGFDFLQVVEGTSSSEDNAVAGKILVFPNPAGDMIQLSGLPDMTRDVHFYNTIGQEVLLSDLGAGFYDVSRLPEGLYIIKAGKYSGKFLKKS